MPSIPIILCGRSPEIANKVQQDLRPEYDVVHTSLTPSSFNTTVPPLLSTPNPPVAIVLGGAFDDAAVADMKKAVSGSENPVVWLRVDKRRMGEMPAMEDKEAFGAALAGRIRKGLGEHKIGEGCEKEGEFLF